jgi:hypothetical protein
MKSTAAHKSVNSGKELRASLSRSHFQKLSSQNRYFPHKKYSLPSGSKVPQVGQVRIPRCNPPLS